MLPTEFNTGDYITYNFSDAPDRDDIQPIFGSDLEEAIKIGSRVVRGKDWSWGNQVIYSLISYVRTLP